MIKTVHIESEFSIEKIMMDNIMKTLIKFGTEHMGYRIPIEKETFIDEIKRTALIYFFENPKNADIIQITLRRDKYKNIFPNDADISNPEIFEKISIALMEKVGTPVLKNMFLEEFFLLDKTSIQHAIFILLSWEWDLSDLPSNLK